MHRTLLKLIVIYLFQWDISDHWICLSFRCFQKHIVVYYRTNLTRTGNLGENKTHFLKTAQDGTICL